MSMKEEKIINFESKYKKHFNSALYIGVVAITVFGGHYIAIATNRLMLDLPIPHFSFLGYQSSVSDVTVILNLLLVSLYLYQNKKRNKQFSPVVLLLFLPFSILIGLVTALLHIH
jgi:hypothetical protein